MQILSGSKRDITMKQWEERVTREINRANAAAECFNVFGGADDLDSLIEHCESIIETARNAKSAIEFMNQHNIT